MNMKKLLSVLVVIMLSLGLVAMAPVSAQVNKKPAQAMWVDPTITGPVAYCNNFPVDIYVNVSTAGMNPLATGLYAWEFKLFYRTAYVNATSFADHLPYANWNPPNSFLGGSGIEPNYNATHGRVWRAVSAMPVVQPYPTPFVGVMSICTINFHVEFLGGAAINGTLALRDTITGDDTGAGFAHTAYDGYYIIPYVPPPPPAIKVSPSYKKGELGTLFNLSIRIEALAPGMNMCGWEAKLGYNTTVLDCLNSFEGPFLPANAGVNGTYYINMINDSIGVVHTAGLFLGSHTEPTGAGTVAYLMFNATYEFLVPAEGSPPFLFAFDLYDTILVSCPGQTINHTVSDGVYEAPYRTLGWSLDCYTWKYRKPLDPQGTLYETPNIGEGPNFPADAFEPQELVVLYAKLTYNEDPEQSKDVAFEIYGPTNPYFNITLFRVARTNSVGIATINFTIPWPCEHPEEIIIGKWYCFQKVQVKDPWNPNYYATPNDTLRWDVGWYVELLNVTVNPSPVHKGTMLSITTCYKTISQIPRWVVFTFTILDDLLDPVGTYVTAGQWVVPGVFCNPTEDCITVEIYIPKWAHVGPRAMVYVNVFSGLPTTCGVPYSPEASTGFSIIAA